MSPKILSDNRCRLRCFGTHRTLSLERSVACVKGALRIECRFEQGRGSDTEQLHTDQHGGEIVRKVRFGVAEHPEHDVG